MAPVIKSLLVSDSEDGRESEDVQGGPGGNKLLVPSDTDIQTIIGSGGAYTGSKETHVMS